MTKIDRIEDLPDWFSIDYYSSSHTFGAIDWYQHLKQRASLIYILQKSRDETDFLAGEYGSKFARCVNFTRGLSTEDAEIQELIGIDGMDQRLTVEQCGVAPLTFRHLYEHASSVPGYELEPEKWFTDMCNSMSEIPTSSDAPDPPLLLRNWASVTGTEYALLRVNRELPIKITGESFIVRLSEMQAAIPRHKKQKRYHAPRFQSWARDGLLPYLDLMIWEMETGIKIPDRVMAVAVRPRSDIGEGNLRKTTIPLAKRLMADGGLAELLELAAVEATAQLPTNLEN
jgi:hypothetical protein